MTDNENENFIPKDQNEQIYIAIEKYLLLISLEFKEHLNKYKSLYTNVQIYSLNIDVY
jgi:hypothetical protein